MRRVARIARAAGQALLLAAVAASAALLIAIHAVDYPVERLSPDRGGPLLLVDRRGQLLRSVAAPGRPGRARWVSLDALPSHALLTVLASEDSRFFAHGGVDGQALARAAWLDLREGRRAYGGSTLTMQLVRMVDSPGQERSWRNKLRESVLALRLERALDKRQILEQYLNRAYYGHGAYGLEAAARLYFGKPASALSVGEATLLAVVPRAPGRYDPIAHLDAARRRRDHVFGLLEARGLLAAGEIERARAQALAPALHPPPFLAPHFTDWVLASLPAEVRARGGVVKTTLDLELQQVLERRVAEHVAELRGRGLEQAGLVVLDTRSGDVLAMVGSAGWDGPHGQVNITTRRRHPGSALKPFVYALAIERGDSPASIAYDVRDVPSRYVVRGQPAQEERGPVRYREALAGSYNLAAVHTLEKVGVERLVMRLREAGLGLPQELPDDYGLRLALGSAKVRLIDLAAAYGFLARGGRIRPARGVRAVELAGGETWRPPAARDRQLFSPEVSWLVMDMLADPQARRPMFGDELPVDLPFRVAAKTGTARGFADTVAVGVTAELTVAAWAGTFDGEATEGLLGMQAAAPLVRDGLLIAGRGAALTLPAAPAAVTSAEVCPLSGLRPGPDCPHRKLDHFVAGSEPTAACDWHVGREVRYPAVLAKWAERVRTRGGRHLAGR